MTRTPIVAGAVLVLLMASCGPGQAPVNQDPLTVLTTQTTIEPVRQSFNAAANETRVILLLSPT